MNQRILESTLDFPQAKLLMVGGKGGVGKTTCSAAIAFHFARSGQRTLLISSDPTPLIINNLVQEADCAFHRRRQAMQRKYLKQLRETYGQRMKLIEVPLLADEVKRIKRIRDIAGILFSGEKKSSLRR